MDDLLKDQVITSELQSLISNTKTGSSKNTEEALKVIDTEGLGIAGSAF